MKQQPLRDVEQTRSPRVLAAPLLWPERVP